MRTPPSPDAILQTGLGFWASKTLLSAVELGVFTTLADGPKTADELRRELALHPRALPDFTDALLALGFLEREGRGEQAAYRNTPATQHYLERVGRIVRTSDSAFARQNGTVAGSATGQSRL